MYRSLEPPAPLMGEMDICAGGLFCTKFNSEQLLPFFDVMRIFGSIKPQSESNIAQILLFEQFFDIISNFDSVQPENESTFPYQYNIIFEIY